MQAQCNHELPVAVDARAYEALCYAGIDADGLPPDLECHHLFVNSWENLDAPQARMLARCLLVSHSKQ